MKLPEKKKEKENYKDRGMSKSRKVKGNRTEFEERIPGWLKGRIGKGDSSSTNSTTSSSNNSRKRNRKGRRIGHASRMQLKMQIAGVRAPNGTPTANFHQVVFHKSRRGVP
ncbi:hypothetical protein M0804_009096 [Polistes exclamans]|nr:hypothetical protein M0804_009096 [Polistes exclamans]